MHAFVHAKNDSLVGSVKFFNSFNKHDKTYITLKLSINSILITDYCMLISLFMYSYAYFINFFKFIICFNFIIYFTRVSFQHTMYFYNY